MGNRWFQGCNHVMSEKKKRKQHSARGPENRGVGGGGFGLTVYRALYGVERRPWPRLVQGNGVPEEPARGAMGSETQLGLVRTTRSSIDPTMIQDFDPAGSTGPE
jgi:hypothetical protein